MECCSHTQLSHILYLKLDNLLYKWVNWGSQHSQTCQKSQGDMVRKRHHEGSRCTLLSSPTFQLLPLPGLITATTTFQFCPTPSSPMFWLNTKNTVPPLQFLAFFHGPWACSLPSCSSSSLLPSHYLASPQVDVSLKHSNKTFPDSGFILNRSLFPIFSFCKSSQLLSTVSCSDKITIKYL